jgi:hypothetical protein
MLETGRSRVQHPVRRIFKFTETFWSLWALGFTHPLTEMGTENIKIMFLESKVQLVRRADNLTAIYEPTV